MAEEILEVEETVTPPTESIASNVSPLEWGKMSLQEKVRVMGPKNVKKYMDKKKTKNILVNRLGDDTGGELIKFWDDNPNMTSAEIKTLSGDYLTDTQKSMDESYFSGSQNIESGKPNISADYYNKYWESPERHSWTKQERNLFSTQFNNLQKLENNKVKENIRDEISTGRINQQRGLRLQQMVDNLDVLSDYDSDAMIWLNGIESDVELSGVKGGIVDPVGVKLSGELMDELSLRKDLLVRVAQGEDISELTKNKGDFLNMKEVRDILYDLKNHVHVRQKGTMDFEAGTILEKESIEEARMRWFNTELEGYANMMSNLKNFKFNRIVDNSTDAGAKKVIDYYNAMEGTLEEPQNTDPFESYKIK